MVSFFRPKGPTATAKTGLQIANTLMNQDEKEITAMEAQNKQIYASLRKSGGTVILE